MKNLINLSISRISKFLLILAFIGLCSNFSLSAMFLEEDIVKNIIENVDMDISQAIQQGRPDMVAQIIKNDETVAGRAYLDGNWPLLQACGLDPKECGSKNIKKIVENLFVAGARIKVRNKNGQGPVSLACEKFNIDLVKLLVKRGAELDQEDNNGNTPLFIACSKGDLQMVRFLLINNVEIDEKSIKESERLVSVNTLVNLAIEFRENEEDRISFIERKKLEKDNLELYPKEYEFLLQLNMKYSDSEFEFVLPLNMKDFDPALYLKTEERLNSDFQGLDLEDFLIIFDKKSKNSMVDDKDNSGNRDNSSNNEQIFFPKEFIDFVQNIKEQDGPGKRNNRFIGKKMKCGKFAGQEDLIFELLDLEELDSNNFLGQKKKRKLK